MRRTAFVTIYFLVAILAACGGNGGGDPNDPDGVNHGDADISGGVSDSSDAGTPEDAGSLDGGGNALDVAPVGDTLVGGGDSSVGLDVSQSLDSVGGVGDGAGAEDTGAGSASDGSGSSPDAGGSSLDAGGSSSDAGGSSLDAGGSSLDAGGAQACSFDAAKGPTGQECPVGESCVVGVGVCSGLVSGVCFKLPDFCAANVSPVCDCGGKTWNNLCVAQKAGVVVKQGGVCPVVGPPCGGQAQVPCPNGQFCEPDSCALDALGKCVLGPKPGPCPSGTPQCGCDGKTWPSVCERMKAKVGLKYDGTCLPDPNAKGCKIGPVKPILCDAGFYCKISKKGACEGLGVCLPRPVACTKELKPVCGCDKTTYSNTCVAAKAGWNIKSIDPCVF